MSGLLKSTSLLLPVIGGLAACSIGQAAAVAVAVESSLTLLPTAIGGITGGTVLPPPEGYPAMTIGGNTREGEFPQYLALEFALPAQVSEDAILKADFSAIAFGGSRVQGTLTYGLFGYSGTGEITPDSGAFAQFLGGPFEYDIDFSEYRDLGPIDVTDFVRYLLVGGKSHAGFIFKDIDTPPDFQTDRQDIVVQESTTWAGAIPPSLTLHLIPEPSLPMLCVVGAVALIIFKRPGRPERDGK